MVSRRSIYVVKDIAVGEAFTTESIRIIRLGYESVPKEYGWLLGKKANKNLKFGDRIN